MTDSTSEEPKPQRPPPPVTGSWSRLRRIRIPLSNTQIVLIILVLAGGRLIYDFSQRVVEGQDMVEQQFSLEDEIIALEEENRMLLAAKIYYSSEAFVETWAHDEGKMVRNGEVLIVPIYQQPASSALPTPNTSDGENEESLEAVAPWRVWWTLFLDTEPPDIEYLRD